ncbi:IMP2L-like protein [Mya arenaria]|uniref:Mitochondrial inner membrane protease subunit 2 n=1 Tax=Mya arenaria TaxID=6604 RepID=A0ABY7FT02_MYAAR|nr:IMP2L-like protein [Mya arenaria]WAR25348.1 IMP2L-like protein [Mya arenaria]
MDILIYFSCYVFGRNTNRNFVLCCDIIAFDGWQVSTNIALDTNDALSSRKYSKEHPSRCENKFECLVMAPYNPKNTVIKRIIALEGDSVSHVNSDDVWVRVPRGQCWVEGDNPRFSKDSNSYGPVPLGLIQAKATHIVWPPRRWCKLNSSNNEYSLPPDRVMPNHITSSHNDYNGRPCTTVI